MSRRKEGKKKMKKLVLMTALVALLGAACGGGDVAVTVDDSPLAQAIADEIRSDTDSPVATEQEADCFAGNVVGRIGESRLNQLGVTADSVGAIDEIDFSDDEIGTIVTALTDCIDLEAAMAQQFEEDFAPDDAKCLAEGLGGDVLEDMLALGLSGDDENLPDEFFQAFLDVAADCDLPLN